MCAADQDRCAERCSSEDERRTLKGYSNAPVACRLVGNDREGVDRQSAVEVERVWQPDLIRARPALPETTDNSEAALWRRGECSGRGVDGTLDRAIFNHQQHLPRQIDLECAS